MFRIIWIDPEQKRRLTPGWHINCPALKQIQIATTMLILSRLNSVLATITFLVISGICSVACNAQVGEVIEKAKENKSGKNRSSDDRLSSGWFFVDMFIGITDFAIRTIPVAQQDILSRKYEEPWLVSLETGFTGGYAGPHNTLAFIPALQGNWGLFSSEFRLNRIFDASGNFQTLDWQILAFNLINREKVKFYMGGGFSHHQKTSDTFMEYATGLKLFFDQRSLSPAISVRWSPDFDTGITTRFELNTRLSKRIISTDRFHVNMMAGLVYQRYFETTDFYFVQAGVDFMIF